MSDDANSLKETLLRQCLAADPAPWYPKEYAQTAGINRESIYGPMNDLRGANLVQLTEWIRGKGQGYIITPLGKEVLDDPVFLAQLREGKSLTSTKETPESSSKINRFELGEAARRAFYFPAKARVAPVLIAINLIMFVISMAVAYRSGVGIGQFLNRGDAVVLHKVGAVSADDLARGEWWRLVTNCFLHFGLLHLALNMFSLALLSRVETLWGSGRFLILYLTCGICGSCAGMYFNPGSGDTIVYLAGASGALWGVMASEATWLALHRSHLPPTEVRRWGQQLFFTLLLNIGVSMLPQVSAAAHVGGAVAGALAAVMLQAHRFGAPSRRTLAGLLLALVPTLFLLGVGAALEFDSRFQPFMIRVHREQIDAKIGKLPASIDILEPKAEKLHLQESTKRDAAELSKVRDGLNGLVKQAKEGREWLDKWTPAGATKALREKGLAMVDALIPFAEALDKHAGGLVVENINDLRRMWQDARLTWVQAMAK